MFSPFFSFFQRTLIISEMANFVNPLRAKVKTTARQEMAVLLDNAPSIVV